MILPYFSWGERSFVCWQPRWRIIIYGKGFIAHNFCPGNWAKGDM
jgi:hypothetical protein